MTLGFPPNSIEAEFKVLGANCCRLGRWIAQRRQLAHGHQYLNLFDTASGRVDTNAAAALHALNGKQPIQLVVQRSQRRALEDAVKPGSVFRMPARGSGSAGALRPGKPVLLVVPGDGHDQTDDESMKHFKIKSVRLDSQQTFLRLAKPDPLTGRLTLDPNFYLTSYTQLTGNGVADFPALDRAHPQRTMSQLNLRESDAVEWWEDRGKIYHAHYECLGVTPETALKEIQAAYNNIRRNADKVVGDMAFESLLILQQLTPDGKRAAGRRLEGGKP